MSDIVVNVTNAGAANVSVSSPATVNTTVGNGGAVNVSLGTVSPGDATVVSGTVQVGTVTTLAPGSAVTVQNSGTAFSAVFDFGIPGTTTDASLLSTGIVPDARLASNIPRMVNNLVQSVNLPSYVDDVVDVGGTLPETGETGKIYVVSTGTNVNKIYRWSGSTFIEISPSPGSTDAVPEGANLYFTTKRAADAAPVQSVAGRAGAITLTSADVGLGNVENTSDANKPVSTAQAAADAAVQAFAVQRANHTGTQTASTISDFATEAAKYGPVVSVAGGTGAVTLTASDVGLGNVTNVDATKRANHTGTQAISTVDGLQAALDGKQAAGNYVTTVNNLTGSLTLAAGANVTITPSGSVLTIDATSSGGGSGLDANAVVDGGDYTGAIVPAGGIIFVTQPQNTTATTSAAGESWSYATTSGLTSYGVVAGNNGTWISFGTVPNKLTGTTWTQANVGTDGSAIAAYGDGKYVGLGVLGSNGFSSGFNYVVATPDGQSWSTPQVTMPFSTGFPKTLIRDGSLWVLAVERKQLVTSGDNTLYSTDSVLTSSDLVTWTARSLPSGAALHCMAAGNGKLVAIGRSSAGNAVAFLSSDSGVTWSAATLPSLYAGTFVESGLPGQQQWLSVAFANNTFVAVGQRNIAIGTGYGSRAVATSTDGVTWSVQETALPESQMWRKVVAANNRFVACAHNAIPLATSADGVTWTTRTLSGAQAAFPNVGYLASDGTDVLVLNGAPAKASVSLTSPVKAATFSALAVSQSPPSYQWQSSTDSGATWSSVENATSTTLSLTNLSTSDNGTRYRALASATGATPATSQSAMLTVTG